MGDGTVISDLRSRRSQGPHFLKKRFEVLELCRSLVSCIVECGTSNMIEITRSSIDIASEELNGIKVKI